MITTVVSGMSLLMVTYATMYGVIKSIDKMIGKEQPIQTIELNEWRNMHVK